MLALDLKVLFDLKFYGFVITYIAAAYPFLSLGICGLGYS